MSNIYYRYYSHRHSVTICAESEIYGVARAKLCLMEYKVHSKTPKGCWIGYFGGKDHWVSDTSVKKFAYPTKEEALKGYEAKKKAYVRHSRNRLKRAEEDLALVQKKESDLLCG